MIDSSSNIQTYTQTNKRIDNSHGKIAMARLFVECPDRTWLQPQNWRDDDKESENSKEKSKTTKKQDEEHRFVCTGDLNSYTWAGFSAPMTTMIFCMNTVNETAKKGEFGLEEKEKPKQQKSGAYT